MYDFCNIPFPPSSASSKESSKIFFGFSVLSFAVKDQGGVVEAEKRKEMGWRNKERRTEGAEGGNFRKFNERTEKRNLMLVKILG